MIEEYDFRSEEQGQTDKTYEIALRPRQLEDFAGQSQVVENLRARGIPVEYILFPDEGHGFRKTKNRIHSTTSIVNWFIKYH